MLVFPGQKNAAGQSSGVDIPDEAQIDPGGQGVHDSAPLAFE
jgi:hypothetical protein